MATQSQVLWATEVFLQFFKVYMELLVLMDHLYLIKTN